MSTEASQLEIAKKICMLLGASHSALIGGLAVSAWGYERGTKDVDFATSLSPRETVKRFESEGVVAKIVYGEPGDPIPWSVNGEITGVPFNILPPLEGISIEKGIDLSIGGDIIRLCRIDDLVRLKLYAGGPQDILDVARLMAFRPEIEQYAINQAKKYGVEEKLIAFRNSRPPLSSRRTESE